MSRNIVITIGREVGSGGREIARKVATLLNINYYDKNILDIKDVQLQVFMRE